MMMLQGHFIDTMLAPAYRDSNHPVFAIWHFMRGMTAPIFFFVSGAIFVFLLLKDDRPLIQNVRINKGLRRAALLLILGYLLKFNLFALLFLQVYPSFIAVDVFHCIGLALLALIGLYALHRRWGWSLPWLYGSLGVMLFVFAPNILAYDYRSWPLFLQNYFTLANGSTFTPIPWVGYSLLGGVLGWHMHRSPYWYHTSTATPWILLMLGLWLHFSTATILNNFYQITGVEQFKTVMHYNHTFWRLGHVLVVFAAFMWITRAVNRIPPLLLKMGSETLVIYSAHYVLLYGTWFGLGIKHLGQSTWSPFAAALGAVLFVALFVYLVYRLEDLRTLLYDRWLWRFKLWRRFWGLRWRRRALWPRVRPSQLFQRR